MFTSGVNQQQHIERTNPWNAWKCHCLRCGQPLSVNLDHRVSGAWETTELVARADRQLLSVCNIMFLCQRLGVALEEGAYSQDKMSDPAYKPLLCFRLALRLQNGGRICGTLRYHTNTLANTEPKLQFLQVGSIVMPCNIHVSLNKPEYPLLVRVRP